MPLNLPDITLVVIDSVAHDLSRLALANTLKQIEPAETIIFSNQPRKIAPKNTQAYYIVDDTINSLEIVANILWYRVPHLITTSHYLVIQYDGWVRDASMWDNNFLSYDYIGAPWPWHAFFQVGNGGFSLRSKRLGDFLVANRKQFGLEGCLFPEDDLLCRHHRGWLEHAHGFKWAPIEVARRFSFEREPHRKTFGFHGIFNLPHVLPPAQFAERKRLANDYVRSKVEWKELG